MTNAKILPFLMFQGKAEEAMNFYVSLFPGAIIEDLARYSANQPGKEGSVMKARFTLGGQTVLCTDSVVQHDFTFTAAFSFFIECGSDDEITRLYETLSAGGVTPMPLNNYGFSRKFAWVTDRFGVSWQLEPDHCRTTRFD
jgi:predicted 3-demethylubiquinone-9 3-methyltransferase (glyoxalase superfamily)